MPGGLGIKRNGADGDGIGHSLLAQLTQMGEQLLRWDAGKTVVDTGGDQNPVTPEKMEEIRNKQAAERENFQPKNNTAPPSGN